MAAKENEAAVPRFSTIKYKPAHGTWAEQIIIFYEYKDYKINKYFDRGSFFEYPVDGAEAGKEQCRR
jgi:hypothetical protein